MTDRLDSTSNTILALATFEINRFGTCVMEGSQEMCPLNNPNLLQEFLSRLFIGHDMILQNVLAEGYEGRESRRCFQEKFEVFVKETHGVLLVK